MSLLRILRYPDPRLTKIAQPVATVDERIRRLVADMLETMYDAHGIGLAASQVDVHEQGEQKLLKLHEVPGRGAKEALGSSQGGCVALPRRVIS